MYDFKRIYILALLPGLAACATLTTKVHNDPPQIGPVGDRVAVTFRCSDSANIGENVGNIVTSHAKAWLQKKGYTIVDSVKGADNHVVFSTASQTSSAYVPGETYQEPTYGVIQTAGSTSVVTNRWGQDVATITTAPTTQYGQTGTETIHRDAYQTNVTDRWLFIEVWHQSHGKSPECLVRAGVTEKGRFSKIGSRSA